MDNMIYPGEKNMSTGIFVVPTEDIWLIISSQGLHQIVVVNSICRSEKPCSPPQ